MTSSVSTPASRLSLLRHRQWLKNGLVIVPLIFSGELLQPGRVPRVLLAFAAFCLASSAGYVLNDLRDRERDRLHPTKRLRPLASGAMSTAAALVLCAGLTAGALGLGALVGGTFVAMVVAYLAGSLSYSLVFRHHAILDVLAIGGLFILRVLAGAVAAEVTATDWLLLLTGILAVFLGLCKRRHELLLLGEDASAHRAVLGEYTARFLDPAISITTSTALIIYLLYARSPETVERVGSSALLLGVPFLLFGLLRYLHLIYSMERSPTDVLVSDPGVLGAALGLTAVCTFVLYG